MTVNERTYDEVVVAVPADVTNSEVQVVLQRWVVERVVWLKARTLELRSSAPVALLHRAVAPPKQILKAADPRALIRTLSHTSAQIGSTLTALGKATRRREAIVPPLPPAADKMRAFWKARVDVLQKMLERKPSP
jgi:hypothetical protein